jgi:hypothetical protein
MLSVWLTATFSAGMVNTITFLACQRFVTHVTGHLTLIGKDIHQVVLMLDYVLVLLSFIAGAMLSYRLIDGRRVRVGDRVVGVASSGVHSNGFSLVRRILEMRGVTAETSLGPGGPAVLDALLAPTVLYASLVQALLADGVEQARPFFTTPDLQETATAQLASEGARPALAALLERLPDPATNAVLEAEQAQALLVEACAAAGVKKGVIMKSLRAALLGSLQGPDLLATWLLLHRSGADRPRISRCL